MAKRRRTRRARSRTKRAASRGTTRAGLAREKIWLRVGPVWVRVRTPEPWIRVIFGQSKPPARTGGGRLQLGFRQGDGPEQSIIVAFSETQKRLRAARP